VPHGEGSSGFAASARHEAAQILSRPPYTNRPAQFPNPLAGALRAIGRGFVWVFGHPARWLWHNVLAPIFHTAHNVLGAGGWVVGLLLALGLGVLVGVLIIRRRSRIAARPGAKRPSSVPEDAYALERAAEEAEAKGDNELAVRLRFQFGLARLEARGVIPDRLTMTSHQLRRVLGSPVFDELATRHESITYAREPASPRDVATARDGWGQLLAETSTMAHDRQDARQSVGSDR